MRRTGLFPAGLALAAVFGLAGCGSKTEDPGVTLGNLFAYNTTKPAPAAPAAKSGEVECPVVDVTEGQAVYRAYGGGDKSNASVKYQFSFGALSRECFAEDSRINIRIGISGYLQAGPAGGSGSASVPVRVVIRREGEQRPTVEKTFRVEATIAPGETSTTFALVTDGLSVPYLSAQADDDYQIFVGFEQGGAAARPEKVARRRRAR